MRMVARLAHPLRNALTTGRVGSAAVVVAVVVTSSGMTTVMGPAVATKAAVEMEEVDTEEVRRPFCRNSFHLWRVALRRVNI